MQAQYIFQSIYELGKKIAKVKYEKELAKGRLKMVGREMVGR